MNEKIQELIFQAIDSTISKEDFETLQDAMEKDPEVRSQYLGAMNLSEVLSEIAKDNQDHPTSLVTGDSSIRKHLFKFTILASSLLAILVIAVGGIAYSLGRDSVTIEPQPIVENVKKKKPRKETTISGYAMLRRSVDIQWTEGQTPHKDGDVLTAGILQFEKGLAEIDFFCGATLVVEGPAKMNLESDWSVQLLQGRLRANVPPAARGFIVKAADSEIIDLGTEFALEVNDNKARVKVIDGEVKLKGGALDGNHLVTGQGKWLSGKEIDSKDKFEELSSIDDINRRRDLAQKSQFEKWMQYSDELRKDSRLIAYYPIAKSENQRLIPNISITGSNRDGQIVGLVNKVNGRFGAISSGLEFDRPGSRVRVRIDGEYRAYTFSCWVKIDNLEHRYNSIFMGDGYENGEPHWQIRDDGKIMFSVMVDDTKEIEYRNPVDNQLVKDAGLHRVYATKPFWDVSKSGQWFHLVAVYDPENRVVNQFVNGELASHHEIKDKFYIEKLRIGPAEIGNWGQPFRSTPWFAVRNLNGAVDELAIFSSALNASEIKTMFEQGKPLGY